MDDVSGCEGVFSLGLAGLQSVIVMDLSKLIRI